MTPEGHARAKELFLAACGLDGESRASFLDERCAGNGELRREVESLLAFHGGDPNEEVTLDAGATPAPGTASGSVGRFHLLGRLGAGGMGEVFLARDPRLGRQVALKALPPERAADPEARRRLESEARALAALNHPHVAALYELEESDDRLYLVLEHVRGETLAERLERGTLPIAEALRLGVQIVSGLEAAHAAGLVHRDLKPLNVMITSEGDAKILDFGLARSLPPSTADATDLSALATLTRPGMVLGTPAYMSPEQARGRPVDPTTDLWALGCLLFECLCGHQVFRGETFSDSIARILEGQPDWRLLPPDLPSALPRLLERCLAKDRRRRLQHAGDARLELEDALAELDSPATTEERAARRRRRVRAGLAATALALATGLAGFFVARWTAPPPTSRPLERRLSVRLPDGQPLALGSSNPLAVARPALALSPDGRHLVWVAAGDSGSHLVHRALDRFETRVLPGTEGAFDPFFSPDGRWVAFFTDGELRKVPLFGGEASPITEARNPYGGTWADDGTLYFAAVEGAKLVKVREDGSGRAEQRLKPLSYWPQALPGNRGLLFSDPVNVLDPATGQITVLADGSFARYLDTGHLLYRNETNLFVVPLDLETLELRGEPEVVFPDARGEPNGSLQLAVGRGDSIAYLPGSQVDLRTALWAGRESLEPALPNPGAYGTVALSPEGDRLAIEVRTRDFEVWIYDLRRGGSRRLPHSRGCRFPVWSAEGREIYCTTNNTLVALSVGGASPLRPLVDGITGFPNAASRDGRWLIFESADADLLLADLTEPGTFRPLIQTAAFEWGAALSPDGRWLAYTSDTSSRYEVYVRAFPEGDRAWPVSIEGGEEPRWMPDGNALVYRYGRRWWSVSFEVDGTTPRLGTPELFLEGDYINPRGFSYDVSPDGSRLLVLRDEDRAMPVEVRLVEGWLPR